MRKRLAVVLAVSATVGAALAGSAIGEQITAGNVILTVDGKVKPRKLPKRERAPITLQVEGDVATVDGATPPVLRKIVMDFDSQGKIYTKGLPTCSTRELENTLTQDALRKCKKALVGRGRTNAIVDFPDQDPFPAPAPLLAFNGKPKGRKPVIIFHAFAHVPTPTTFVVPAKISNAPGRRFGNRVKVEVPPIAGSNGSLTHFDIKINRTWRHKGKKRSYVSAKCTRGRFVAKGRFSFADATKIDARIVRKCKSKRGA